MAFQAFQRSKKLKSSERLGATYGPMLTKMRIEVKNERGIFMSITAPGADARKAAPLPPRGGAGGKPSGPIPDAGGSPARKKGEAGLLEAAQTGNVADVVSLLLEGVSPSPFVFHFEQFVFGVVSYFDFSFV